MGGEFPKSFQDCIKTKIIYLKNVEKSIWDGKRELKFWSVVSLSEQVRLLQITNWKIL